MLLALNNVYCAHLSPATAVLGAAHGSYGIGGTFTPVVATLMVSRGIPWSRFYFVPFGLSLLVLPISGWVFRKYEEYSSPTLLSTLEQTASRQAANENADSKLQDLKLALGNRVTLIGASFIFAYQGAEVAISGWVISYLINYRDGDPAQVGFVTAGFWVSDEHQS